MKKVVNKEMVAHLFANRSQDEARTPTGNMYFTGPICYSYGSHFVLAVHLPEKYNLNGRPLTLLNSNSYSNTTNKHKSAIWDACRHLQTAYVPGMKQDDVYRAERCGIPGIRKTLFDSLKGYADAAAKPRIRETTREYNYLQARTRLELLQHLNACDKVKQKLPNVPESLDKEAAIAFARELNFADWCESFAEAIARLRRSVEDFNGARDDYGPHSLRNAAGNVGAALRRAEEFARKAEKRIPAKLRKEAAAILASVPELDLQCARYDRERVLGQWENTVSETRRYIAESDEYMARRRINYELGRIQNAADVMDTPEEKQARAELIDELGSACDEIAKREAPERARIAEAAARDALAHNRHAEALRMLGKAEDNGASLDELRALIEASREAWNADALARWRAGGREDLDGTFLRVRGERVETSRGAEIPVAVCPMVWRAVNGCRDANRAHSFEHDKRPRLGSFSLDYISETGDIRAGCHEIAYSEIEYIARVLGYIA